MPARDTRFGLLRTFVNYDRKKFYNIGQRSLILELSPKKGSTMMDLSWPSVELNIWFVSMYKWAVDVATSFCVNDADFGVTINGVDLRQKGRNLRQK
jgi:hypothetical protein